MNVGFPGLGLDFHIRRWAFEIFGLPIYWYGIIIALAFLAAVVLGLRSCKKYELEPDNVLDMVLFAAPAAVIGARLYFVIFSWDQYKGNLIDVIKIRDGGLAVYGGVIAAVLVAWIYSRVKKLSFLNIMDFAAPYIILGQGIGRWGNFVNQEAFGVATQLPWRMNGDLADKYLSELPQALDPAKWGVHPTFLYESLWDFAVFFLLLWFRKKKKKLSGEVLFMYIILYGIGRAFIEGLRTDSLYMGSLRVSQFLSGLLVLVFIIVLFYRRFKKAKASEDEPVELGQSQYGSLLTKMKEEEAQEAGNEKYGSGMDEEVSAAGTDLTADETDTAIIEEEDSESEEKADNDSNGKEK
ncbi:MAG TPA: prolipoprotein diacylglyceryl transferase [Clostridia bacterium]|nr:prolipoprotein diacylglyceryl transferase [Clostridia bacterium]